MTRYGSRPRNRVAYGHKDPEVLRSVLYDLWNGRCYWCHRSKDFTDIQTDHIIPKSLRGHNLTNALDRVGRPHSFDRDAPENLAPICGFCNGRGEKGDNDMTHLPTCGRALDKARERAPEVVERVRAFRSQKELAKAFVGLKSADLDDAKIRTAFEQNMPAVLRRLSARGLDDFPLFRVLSIGNRHGELFSVPLELEGESKRAVTLLEGLIYPDYGLADVLDGPLLGLWEQVHTHAHSSFEAFDEDGLGPCNSGPPEASYFRAELQRVSSAKFGNGSIEFTLEGEFEAHLSAGIVRDDPSGWETSTVEGQADGTVEGSYCFTVSWDGGATSDDPVVNWGDEDYWSDI
ncbi:HNH endonuclease [Pseudactinotalea terrae]|uniref:HNH endonuclease n=1 Tax=Pseudactinotalea terrae TaxID=1743262 RepID=UPI0012E1A1D3|nr:hypothetical protein [Pseudactinotalea terrae]